MHTMLHMYISAFPSTCVNNWSSFPLDCFCLSTAPSPYKEASKEIRVSLPGSNSVNTGLVQSSFQSIFVVDLP